jgi:hypothetical protein
MKEDDFGEIEISINEDNLVTRLEKLTVFMKSLSEDISKNDTEPVLEKVLIQKKVYEEAQRLFRIMIEEDIDKEKAKMALRDFCEVYSEYNQQK